MTVLTLVSMVLMVRPTILMLMPRRFGVVSRVSLAMLTKQRRFAMLSFVLQAMLMTHWPACFTQVRKMLLTFPSVLLRVLTVVLMFMIRRFSMMSIALRAMLMAPRPTYFTQVHKMMIFTFPMMMLMVL